MSGALPFILISSRELHSVRFDNIARIRVFNLKLILIS